MTLVDQLEEKWVPKGHPVLDLVPPDFQAPADIVFNQRMGSPVVTKRNFWAIFKTMRDKMDQALTTLPPTFRGQMGSALDEDENRHREVVELLDGYQRLRRRPPPTETVEEAHNAIAGGVEDGDGADGAVQSDWDPDSDDNKFDFDFEGNVPLLEVELTNDE